MKDLNIPSFAGSFAKFKSVAKSLMFSMSFVFPLYQYLLVLSIPIFLLKVFGILNLLTESCSVAVENKHRFVHSEIL